MGMNFQHACSKSTKYNMCSILASNIFKSKVLTHKLLWQAGWNIYIRTLPYTKHIPKGISDTNAHMCVYMCTRARTHTLSTSSVLLGCEYCTDMHCGCHCKGMYRKSIAVRIWRSYSTGCEEFCLLEYNALLATCFVPVPCLAYSLASKIVATCFFKTVIDFSTGHMALYPRIQKS